MIEKKKKIELFFYLFIALNIAPLLGIVVKIVDFHTIAFFYWIECALVAILAVAIYARYLIIFFLLSASMGGIIYLANPLHFANLSALLVFWCLYSICWLIYIEIGKSDYGQILRRLSPGGQLCFYLAFMSIAILLCFFITTLIEGSWHPKTNASSFYKTLLSISILVPTISMGMLKIIDMIGQKHFINFLLGTYHHPVERKHIVLFLDMVGSSAMAEKLEAKQSMKLISNFIYDSSYIFRIHGGDVLNYTGDGLVVLWPIHKADAALNAVYKLRSHFSSRPIRADYWKKFGIIPNFRIGIHAGSVILSQIGEEKLFIGLYGDVVNTAARLEQMNKETKTSVLLSSEVIHGLSQSWRTLLKPLGEKEIRGRDEKINVYSLYQDV